MMEPFSPDTLLAAYREGIFPMADARGARGFSWYRPTERGVLPIDASFRLPRKLARQILSGRFDVTTNKNFREVIENCACAPGRDQTWISEALQILYERLHASGHAHSIEVWSRETLVGGLYGVSLGGAFFGESMFSLQPNASKTALVHLVAALRLSGYLLLDIQFQSTHLLQFGCRTLPGDAYMRSLRSALALKTRWPDTVTLADLREEIVMMRKSRDSCPSARMRKRDDD